MKSVEEFLVYAARLEQEAALRFDELADVAASFANKDVAEFFRQMAYFSRLHLDEARKRGGFHDLCFRRYLSVHGRFLFAFSSWSMWAVYGGLFKGE